MNLLNKLSIFVSLLFSQIAGAHLGASMDLDNDDINQDLQLSDEQALIHFTKKQSYSEFISENECIEQVNNGEVDENEVVVDLTDCDTIIINPDIEILAAVNRWGGGGQR